MTYKEYRKCLELEVFKSCRKGIKGIVDRYSALHLVPSTNAVYLIRKMQYLASSNKFNKLRSILIKRQLVIKYGLFINRNALIGIGLRLPHPTSIIIGDCVIIGENCTLYQNTTLGGSRTGDVIIGNQPHLGNNCTVFAGGMVLGKVYLGDNCIVGANSLLLSDADENGIYIGSPAKKLK